MTKLYAASDDEKSGDGGAGDDDLLHADEVSAVFIVPIALQHCWGNLRLHLVGVSPFTISFVNYLTCSCLPQVGGGSNAAASPPRRRQRLSASQESDGA